MNKDKQQRWQEWLILNSQLGDRRAVNELLSDWYPRWMAYAVRRLGDRGLAREAVQEVMLAISRGLVRLTDPAVFPSWSFTLLERRCVDRVRARMREQRKMARLLDNSSLVTRESEEDRLVIALSVEQTLARLDSQLLVAAMEGRQ